MHIVMHNIIVKIKRKNEVINKFMLIITFLTININVYIVHNLLNI
jgi:hypothetical protein